MINDSKIIYPEEATKHLVLARRIYIKHEGFQFQGKCEYFLSWPSHILMQRSLILKDSFKQILRIV
jgi:hypothetical protein